MRTREQIKEGYETFPDHLLKHVVKYNRISIIGAPRNDIVVEKELVADVAQEILDEREGVR